MFLISTAGKSKEQIKKEARDAFLKYQKVEAQVLQKMSHQKPQKKPQLQLQPKEKRDTSTLPHRLLIPFSLSAEEALVAVKAHLRIKQANSSVTPATTPPVKTPRLSTEEFWKNHDTTKEHLGGAIQITNYPHTRKSKILLSREKLAKRLYQELQARYTSTPTPPMTQKSTEAQFLRKTTRYPKNKL